MDIQSWSSESVVNMMHNIGKWMILAGVVLLCFGIVFYFFGEKLSWVGKLPGDIRIEKDNMRVYIPITTMILFSVLLTIFFRIIKFFS